jgi:hypothetical protein
VAAIGTLAIAQGAMADPNKGDIFPATCNGQPVLLAVNGNGEFTLGHVIGGSSVLIPQAFDLTFSFTPPGGPTESETDTSTKSNVHGDLTTCSLNVTEVSPEGTFTLVGTVTGFFTPAGH